MHSRNPELDRVWEPPGKWLHCALAMQPERIQVAQITWSEQLRILRAEGDCEPIFGRTGSALLGCPLHEGLGVSLEKARELDSQARSADSPRTEFVLQEGGKNPIRLVLSLREGVAGAEVTGWRRSFEGASSLQISKLCSSLSHEIRNPLSSVKLAIQTIARNATLSERDTRRLAIANREVRAIEGILWLLSEYGRDAPLALESTALGSLLQNAAAAVEPELSERRIQVQVEDPNAARVRVDSERFRRVLSQLILNVAMAQPEASIVQVSVTAAPSGGYDVVLLDPSASLLPRAEISLLAHGGSLLAGGARLSLAALSRLLELHGGCVTAASNAGAGTLYTLHFPA